MSHRHVVTFIGDDRTGIVEALAATIEKLGGNWLESRLSQLEGKFAGLILVEIDASVTEDLENQLALLPGGEWRVRVTPAGIKAPASVAGLTLSLIGPDRPGIIREVSKALAAASISVIDLESSVESAPFTGEPMFRATITASLPEGFSPTVLETRLDEIADTMTLDIDLER